MKRVISVSLGASSRDKWAEMEILGERVLLERLGTDGSLRRFERLLRQFSDTADVLCLGGMNLGVHWRGEFYPYTQVQRIVECVENRPVVDGSGLKATLEPLTVQVLAERGLVEYSESRCLMAGTLDRYWLARALCDRCKEIVFAETLSVPGLKGPMTSMERLDRWAGRLLPILTRLPYRWTHPAGARAEETRRVSRLVKGCELFAGDFVCLRPFLPEDLSGRVIITNTTTSDDEMMLRSRGLRLLVTSTPVISGRAFATNVMEGVFVSLLNRPPSELSGEDYLDLASEMNWEPEIRRLSPGDTNK